MCYILPPLPRKGRVLSDRPTLRFSGLLVVATSLGAFWSLGCRPDEKGLGRPASTIPSGRDSALPVTVPSGPAPVSTPADAATADSGPAAGPDGGGAPAPSPVSPGPPDAAAAPDAVAVPAASAALAGGLLLFLPFERVAGRVSDHSGHDGTVSLVDFGTSNPFVEGRSGDAVALGGGATGGYVRVDSPDFNGISGFFTISAWIRQGVLSSPDGVVLARFSSSQNGDAYSLRISQNRLRGLINAVNGYHADLSAPMVVPFDVWTHVAMTYDLGNVRLYIDGRQVAAAPYLLGIAPDLTPVLVGGGGAIGRITDRLHADLDDVALYGRTLTPAEIAALARGVRPLVR
jgi:hypothetical protein